MKNIISDLNLNLIEQDTFTLKSKKDYIVDLQNGIEELKTEVKFYSSNRNYNPYKLTESINYLNKSIKDLETIKLI